MKVFKAIKELFHIRSPSQAEIQAAIARSMDYQWKTRLPDAPGVLDKYLSFVGNYRLTHSTATYLEAHDACMKEHPEYWPTTLPQKKAGYPLKPA
jgi:hypothetical protein